MRKLLIFAFIFLINCCSVFAAKFPDEVKSYINSNVPQADIRFDGVITFPSNTIYLPLFPSLFSNVKSISIKETVPANKELKDEPDIVIFNNDFVIMKVLSDGEGHRTVLHQTNPSLQVRTGLLPQDMLVPSGLIIPENIKGIIGNLKIDTKNEDSIKIRNEDSFEEFLSKNDVSDSQTLISQLKNKIVYVSTNYSKNIQVVEPAKSSPLYSLAQKSIPIDIKAVKDGKFLLVTTYDRPFLDIVSIADSRFIKQISLGSNPEQILLDEESHRAYITAPEDSIIFVFDTDTMTLTQKIKVNGYCEHLLLADDKLFYVDKLNNEIWSIEVRNNYQLKDIGNFPNVSALAFADNKLFIASRTKSRIAVVDYNTFKLLNEFTTVSKPSKMLMFGNYLYVLGSQSNQIQKVNTDNYKSVCNIALNTDGFSYGMNRINDTNLYIVTDLKNNIYTIVDMSKDKVLKSYKLNIPLKDVIIADKVRLFE